MDVQIHPHALKHLSKEEVLEAWQSVTKSIKRNSKDEPARWLSIGWLENGKSVELVEVELEGTFLIIHANSPVQKKFAKEIEKIERRLR